MPLYGRRSKAQDLQRHLTAVQKMDFDDAGELKNAYRTALRHLKRFPMDNMESVTLLPRVEIQAKFQEFLEASAAIAVADGTTDETAPPPPPPPPPPPHQPTRDNKPTTTDEDETPTLRWLAKCPATHCGAIIRKNKINDHFLRNRLHCDETTDFLERCRLAMESGMRLCQLIRPLPAGCREKGKLLQDPSVFGYVQCMDKKTEGTVGTAAAELKEAVATRCKSGDEYSTVNPSRQLVDGIPHKNQFQNSPMHKCCSIAAKPDFMVQEPHLTTLLSDFKTFLGDTICDVPTRTRKYRKMTTLLVLYTVMTRPNLDLGRILDECVQISKTFIDYSPDLTATKRGYISTMGKEFFFELKCD